MVNAANGALALLLLWGGAILGLIVGVSYFVKADQSAKLWVRLLASAFGPSLAVLFVVAGLWGHENHLPRSTRVQVHGLSQAIPFCLLVFALISFPGSRRTHHVLLPLGLLSWAWTFAVGWLVVHGK